MSADDGADLLGALAALLHNSLVVRELGDPADGVGQDEADEPRVRMLEPIRDFAREQLAASGEEAPVQRRHAAYYRAFALEAAPHLTGPEQLTWLRRLEPEQYNLRVAVRALLNGGEVAAAVDLVWALWRYWRISGQQREARGWAEEALAAGTTLSPLHRAQALLTAGMARFDGGAPAADSALEEAMRLYREAGDRLGQALALLFLGRLSLGERDAARAESRLEESLRLFRALGAEWGSALALTNLGLVLLLRGDYDQAVCRLEEGLAAARTAGDGVPFHQALYGLGLLARAHGDEDRAVELFAEGLALAGKLRDRFNAGHFIKGLGAMAAGRGRAAEAARLLGAAEAVLQASGPTPYRYVLEGP